MIHDQNRELEIRFEELINWVASMLTNYTIESLHRTQAHLFLRLVERAEEIHRLKMRTKS